jgi:hypothetical protein
MGNNAETPFSVLFLKTLESVLEVVLLSAGGYILAKVRLQTTALLQLLTMTSKKYCRKTHRRPSAILI